MAQLCIAGKASVVRTSETQKHKR